MLIVGMWTRPSGKLMIILLKIAGHIHRKRHLENVSITTYCPGEKSPLDTNMAYGRSLLKYNTTTADHIAVRTDSLIRRNAGKATLQN